MLLLTIMYITTSGVSRETWTGLDINCLTQWSQFVKMSYMGLLMVGYDSWISQIGTLVAGHLGTVELDAQAIILQISNVAFMLSLGIDIAVAIQVGQYLGEGSADRAKTTAAVALVTIAVIGCIFVILLGGLHLLIPLAFTADNKVLQLAADILPVLGFFMIFDSICGVCGAILRGMGQSSVAALVIVTVYTLALASGLPTMLLTDTSVIGYWWCLAVVFALASFIFYAVVFRTDWEKEVENAYKRTSVATGYEDVTPESDSALSKQSLQPGSGYHEAPIAKNISSETSTLLAKLRPPKKTLLIKALTITINVLILITGILIRIFVPPPSHSELERQVLPPTLVGRD